MLTPQPRLPGFSLGNQARYFQILLGQIDPSNLISLDLPRGWAYDSRVGNLGQAPEFLALVVKFFLLRIGQECSPR